MADVKQILVVDDHFEMLEMLRSMLEISSKDHQVLAVPSAEEGLLELRLTSFDLLNLWYTTLSLHSQLFSLLSSYYSCYNLSAANLPELMIKKDVLSSS